MTVFGKDYALISGGDASGLQSAISFANANSGSPYNIFLEAGTYNVMGTLVIFGVVKIYGVGIDLTVIRQGQQDPNQMAGIMTVNSTALLELHNLNIQDGLAKAPQFGAVDGAGIKVWSGTLKIHDCKFDNNDADGLGGAIRNIGGSVEIRRSIFSSNQANVGGAIFTSSSQSDAVNIDQARFTANHADDLGGVIAVSSNSPTEIHNSSFLSDNTAGSAYSHIHNSTTTAVDAVDNWWDPSPDVSPNVTTSPVLSSDPSLSPISPEQTMVNELSDYGITAHVAGTGGSSPGTGTAKARSLPELRQVLIGVQQTARAFNLLKNGGASGTNSTAKSLFQTVMGSFELLRVENGYQIAGCTGTQDEGCTSNDTGTMLFYGNVNVSQYTVAHELGHRFDNRSDQNNKDSLSERLGRGAAYGGVIITDCNGDRVLGEIAGEWVRGERGWGSGPGFSDFQQNPQSDPGKTDGEIFEAAADMFLNWVYRRNSDTIPNDPCTDPLTGTWEGFKNVNWSLNPPQNDNTRPGNKRYQWAENTIDAIFGDQGW